MAPFFMLLFNVSRLIEATECIGRRALINAGLERAQFFHNRTCRRGDFLPSTGKEFLIALLALLISSYAKHS